MSKITDKLTDFSFGSTSAIITISGLIVGLSSAVSKSGIIGTLLIFAIADNISDSLSINVYQESKNEEIKKSLFSTIGNFFARLIISLSFILIVLLFSLPISELISSIWAIFLLGLISYSYLIAIKNKFSPTREIIKHLVAAVIVIFISKYLGNLIHKGF
jgi:VIT1/CCC1 family predicted Fe2+/Mn2+ transporter